MNRIQALTAMMAIVITATLTTSAFGQTPATGVNETQPAVQPSPSLTPPTATPPTATPSTATPIEPVTAAPTLAANCDASAQICFDDRGISVELTRQYFGDAAANSLQQGLR